MFWLLRLIQYGKITSLIRFLRLNKSPILIGGCGRSGTSLLLSVLSAHPAIIAIPTETSIYGSKRPFKSAWLNYWNNWRKILGHVIKYPISKTAKRWCEKTPRNICFLEQTFKEFGTKVKVIQIVRDGRDVVSSTHPGSNQLHSSVDRWIHDVSMGIRFIEHPQVCTIRYEDLIASFESTIKKVLDFIGEDFTVEIKNYHQYANVKKHEAFVGSKVAPIYQGSIGKWKNNSIPEVDMLMQEEDAKSLLRFYNYL